MVSFRRKKKRRHNMQDKEAADEIRVTDRRRINLDNETSSSGDAAQSSHANDESFATKDTPGAKPKYVEELEQRASAAEQKLIEVQARFDQLRKELQRETDETRQRLNRAADERARQEKVNFIAALLPVADNLQRAITAAEAGGSFEALLEGVRGTASGFQSALLAAGVQPLATIGAEFDPELHEAVDTVDVEPDQAGTIVGEYSRGYQVDGKLLRPARVQVGRAQSAQSKQAAE
jgi:molecular chaperone GrpE